MWGRPKSAQATKANATQAPFLDNIQGLEPPPEPGGSAGNGASAGDDSDDDLLAMGPGVTAPTPSTALSRPGPRGDEDAVEQLAALFEVRERLEEAALVEFVEVAKSVEEESDPSSKARGQYDEVKSYESTRDRSWDPSHLEYGPQVTKFDTSRIDVSALNTGTLAVRTLEAKLHATEQELKITKERLKAIEEIKLGEQVTKIDMPSGSDAGGGLEDPATMATKLDTSRSNVSAADGGLEDPVTRVQHVSLRGLAQQHRESPNGAGSKRNAEVSLVALFQPRTLMRQATCCACNSAPAEDNGDLVEVIAPI